MPWFDTQTPAPSTEPFLVELRAAIARWPEPVAEPRFIVAFSGGLDSTVLLAALCRLGLATRVRAVHVDHGLQAEAARWAEHCAAAAHAFGVEFMAVRVAVDRDSGSGLEAAARDARYRALGDNLGPGDVLLTAHHRDDQLETVLLRLLRGSGVRGLRGIIGFGSYGHGFLGRPLLAFTRAELEAQGRAWGLGWIEDPSNRSTRHDRNFLRLTVLPPLLERWPAAVDNVARLAEQMAEAEEILTGVAAEDARAIAVPGRVPRAALERLDAARQRNLLRYVLREAGLGVPSALKVDELRRALLDARADAQPLVRWPGGEGRVYRQQLHLLPTLPAPSARGRDGVVTRAAGWRGPEGDVALEPAGGAAGVPDAWLDDGLALRFRVGGEELHPLERRHRQPLRHWFQEAGVLPWMRSRIPLLYRGDVLVAVGDLWLTDDVAQVSPTEPRWRVVWTGHPPVI
jgi:tRNA(Ile)-lysidine synthase